MEPLPEEAIAAEGGKKRRSGAVLVTDPAGKLAGIFTDSDLARLLEHALHKRIQSRCLSIGHADHLLVIGSFTGGDANPHRCKTRLAISLLMKMQSLQTLEGWCQLIESHVEERGFLVSSM